MYLSSLQVRYQRPGIGQRRARAVSLLGEKETKAWLEARLGPLAQFEAVAPTEGEADEDREAAE